MYDVLTVVAAGIGAVFMLAVTVLFGWRAAKKGKRGRNE